MNCVYSLLKNHASILLAGDNKSLTWLHEVIHDANERIRRRQYFLYAFRSDALALELSSH